MAVIRSGLLVVLCSSLVLFPADGAAQTPDTLQSDTLLSPADGPRARREGVIPRIFPPGAALVPIGSPMEDRERSAQVLGRAPTTGYLLRSPSLRPWPITGDTVDARGALLPPMFRSVWNSDIPLTLNEGGMWAGRGRSTRWTVGLRIDAGPISLILAPELTRIENEPFEFIPTRSATRSPYSPPWRTGTQSADLPVRFGSQPFTLLSAGQSALTVRAGPVAAGAATESQWWGPGIRNAIVMSNHAQGIPHLFLRTARPLETRLGTIEGRWIVGGLTPSLFFDATSSRQPRSLSGIVLAFQPAGEPDLTLGLSRVVYADVEHAGAVLGRSFDVLTWWAPQPSAPPRPAGDGEPRNGREQILSLFGRWILPAEGFEVYAEWARLELPVNLRDLLTAPNHTQGYTLGLQWARPLGDPERLLRVQGEVTYLEQTPVFNSRPSPSFYVGRSVALGYTNRGQVIGAAIGPGASSQWLALDYFGHGWQAGLFGSRIRWDNDAYYAQPTGRLPLAHDVSMLSGFRAGASTRWGEIHAEVIRENRLNFLYQNPSVNFDAELATDVRNTSFRLLVAPAFRAQGAAR
jgi:hypothetical protein